jgi:EmrB/QacA subfamily drug resistance transporter
MTPKTIGRFVLLATISASGMAFLESSVLNVSLPTIQAELNATSADLLWIANIYTLLLGALILVGGALGDRFGRVRVFRVGIIIFTVGNLACGLAPSTPLLIMARIIQGVGGAMMVPGSLAIISAYFSGSERGQAIGTWSSFTTIANLGGPLLGGFLTDIGLWRANFFLLVPFALVSLWALRYVPESKDENAPRQLDYWGAFLVTISLGAIVYGATEIGREGAVGFSNPVNVLALLGGIGLFVAFIWLESRSSHPLVNLALFRSRMFSGLNAFTFLLYGALGVAIFFAPLNLQQVQGYSALEAGSAFLPLSFALILLSPRVGRWADKNGARVPLVLGGILAGFGFLLFAPSYPSGFQNYWTSYFWAVLVLGVGMGILVAPLVAALMGSVAQHNAGVASGVNNALSRVAGVLLTAILGGVMLVLFANALPTALANNAVPNETVQTIMSNPVTFAPAESLLNSVSNATSVSESYRQAFQSVFPLVMVICALLAWLSSAIAFFTVPSGNRATA